MQTWGLQATCFMDISPPPCPNPGHMHSPGSLALPHCAHSLTPLLARCTIWTTPSLCCCLQCRQLPPPTVMHATQTDQLLSLLLCTAQAVLLRSTIHSAQVAKPCPPLHIQCGHPSSNPIPLFCPALRSGSRSQGGRGAQRP